MTKYTTQKLFSPDVNISLGTRYFASLLQQFDRRVELALAAYNAGEDRVQGWMQDFGDIQMAEFVERIPFSETRDYVKQVLTNASIYRMLSPRKTNS
jgi:soluble lytic murein transglycosylase